MDPRKRPCLERAVPLKGSDGASIEAVLGVVKTVGVNQVRLLVLHIDLVVEKAAEHPICFICFPLIRLPVGSSVTTKWHGKEFLGLTLNDLVVADFVLACTRWQWSWHHKEWLEIVAVCNSEFVPRSDLDELNPFCSGTFKTRCPTFCDVSRRTVEAAVCFTETQDRSGQRSVIENLVHVSSACICPFKSFWFQRTDADYFAFSNSLSYLWATDYAASSGQSFFVLR